ncbi:MAG: Gfo/Idh/MocA family oxidoreductase [Bryobacterales bacterium]|nr:Gfo/Idh/MocA family oxidoreductase [Bryobacterales bacterium]
MPSRRRFLRDAAFAAASMSPAAGAEKKIRLAVVGGGFGATFHFHQHPNCVVAAVTDLYAERRKRLRDAYSCDNVYDSLEDLLKKRQDLDAVAIFSGANLHVRHVKMCMERGLHVCSAVPACFNLEEAGELRAIKEKTGLRYMMAESSYYRQAAIHARNLYNEGSFGEILYSEVEYYHDFNFEDRLNKQPSLYYNPDGSISWRMGMPPMHYPTHSLGFVVGVTRERIVNVSCQGIEERAKISRLKANPYRNPFFNEFALMRTSKGHMVRHNECRQISATEMERAQWYGEKGSLLMAKPGIHGDIWQDRYGKPRPLDVPKFWNSGMLPPAMRHDSGHGGSAVFLSAEFINCLLENREPTVNVYEALAMTVPGLIAHQSALRKGEQMNVPSFDRA